VGRIAIVGTAQTWKLTPWTDPGLKVWSLNDAYRLKGFGRADAWYDLHPMDHFHYVQEGQGQVYAHQVPPGHYVRPKDHVQWLAQQSIPVWLHPDYLTQHPDASTWRHAHAFPRAEIQAEFGMYFTSSPAWMMAHAVMQGHKEIHIYGIHLATEHEYIEQRPNFEFLIGRVLGSSRMTVQVKNGLRYHETQDGLVVLPEASPILSSDFQYAFEPRPRSHLEPLRWEMHKIGVKQARLIQELRKKKRWQSARAIDAELQRLEARHADVQEQMQRIEHAGKWS
jgi:hypothetical protein